MFIFSNKSINKYTSNLLVHITINDFFLCFATYGCCHPCFITFKIFTSLKNLFSRKFIHKNVNFVKNIFS